MNKSHIWLTIFGLVLFISSLIASFHNPWVGIPFFLMGFFLLIIIYMLQPEG